MYSSLTYQVNPREALLSGLLKLVVGELQPGWLIHKDHVHSRSAYSLRPL